MKIKISVAACAVLALFAAQANAAETVKLQGVEVNSVGITSAKAVLAKAY